MSITFTKLFSSITESTIWCEPSETRIVWITMLAMADKNGRVWASVPGLANRAQVSLSDAQKALKKFLSPDEHSRTKDHEGRRIEPIDGGWRLLNHAKYRAVRDDEERKAYKRDWIKEKRKADKDVDNVDKGRPPSSKAEAYTEAEANKPKTKGFIKPTIPEIQEYCSSRSNNVDAEQFIDHYTSNGWKVGKNSMKCWKAAVRTWERRGTSNEKNGRNNQSNAKRISDTLEQIAREDIEQNGFTE